MSTDTNSSSGDRQPREIRRPRRPEPDDVERFVRLGPHELRRYRQWRRVREIQKYWRKRERELRPDEMVRLAGLAAVVMCWWLRFWRAVYRVQR